LAAHLVTPRRFFTHHGLYVGDGLVIHYAGLGRGPGGRVEIVSLQRFARGRGVRTLAGAPRFAPQEAIARARSRLGETAYRLFSNNCEHFCAWCLYGRSRSLQVEALRRRWRIRRAAWVAALAQLTPVQLARSSGDRPPFTSSSRARLPSLVADPSVMRP
jgi:hypothetical protein